MAGRPGRKRKGDAVKRRHRFFLNPYKNKAYAKCPVCDARTRIREIVLVIRLEPGQLLLMNLPCRFCRECDLIIANKHTLGAVMAGQFRQEAPELIGVDYTVTGTIDNEDWIAGSSGALGPRDIKERMYAFRDVWNFDVSPPGGGQP
ncbi:MAG: hypothetical protein AB9873_03930 [Syntrophobacteraceae bacterium]